MHLFFYSHIEELLIFKPLSTVRKKCREQYFFAKILQTFQNLTPCLNTRQDVFSMTFNGPGGVSLFVMSARLEFHQHFVYYFLLFLIAELV